MPRKWITVPPCDHPLVRITHHMPNGLRSEAGYCDICKCAYSPRLILSHGDRNNAPWLQGRKLEPLMPQRENDE